MYSTSNEKLFRPTLEFSSSPAFQHFRLTHSKHTENSFRDFAGNFLPLAHNELESRFSPESG